MTTNDPIARLTSELKPVSQTAVLQRVATGLGISLVASALLMYFWFGLRPDFATAILTTSLWIKFAYTLILAATGAWAVKRIAHPLGSIGVNLGMMAAALAVIGFLAFAQLANAEPAQHYAMLMGRTVRA